jgi:hypothetical protein
LPSISSLSKETFLALEESERPITTELLEFLEPQLLTDLKNYKSLMLVRIVDFLRSRKLVMTTSLS